MTRTEAVTAVAKITGTTDADLIVTAAEVDGLYTDARVYVSVGADYYVMDVSAS